MKKAIILTRSFNRLEYTIKTIDSVIQNTDYPHYKHIIIDNGSTDGTRNWLEWIKSSKAKWFKNIDYDFTPNNLGDWGGMRYGIKKYYKDFEYIVQLDNDIEVSKGWLSALIEVLENEKVDSVMLKRTGVQNNIETSNYKEIVLKDKRTLKISSVPFVVACYIAKSDFLFSICDQVKRCRDFGKILNKKCLKINSLNCYHIDGWNGKDYIQFDKYPKSKSIWEKFS